MKKPNVNLAASREKSIKPKVGDDLSSKAATTQVIVSFVANLAVLSSGMALGFPAITSQLLLRNDGDGVVLTSSQVSWFASITALTTPFGAPVSGYLTDKIGRLKTLMLINVMAIVSWLLIGFSSTDNAEVLYVQLMVGRGLVGFGMGMVTTPAVVYVSEVCHPKLRGRLTVLSTPFFISFGMLLAYLLGYLIPTNFRLVALIAAGITFVTIIVLFLIPESPVYLVTKNKIDKARDMLSMIRDLHKTDLKIDAEIERIKESRKITSKKQSIFAIWKEFRHPELYKPFAIMVSFFAIQQFSGVFVIFVYAAQFSIEAGVAIDEFLSAVMIGLIRCVTTILIAFISDKYGKKPPTIVSGIGMFLSMSGLVLCSAFPLNDTSFYWLPTALLYMFIFTGTLGFLTFPFAMVAEMYPQKNRSFAVGITMSLAWAMSFATIKTFITVFEYFGAVIVFSFYAVVTFIGIFFAIFILPETKGKSLSEIEELFRRK